MSPETKNMLQKLLSIVKKSDLDRHDNDWVFYQLLATSQPMYPAMPWCDKSEAYCVDMIRNIDEVFCEINKLRVVLQNLN